MKKHFKILAIVAGAIWSQGWGATVTTYTPGIEEASTGIRRDTLLCGTAGNFNGYTDPVVATTKALYITLVNLTGAAVANGAVTTATTLPAAIKDLWILGDATDYVTVAGGPTFALPTPAAGTTVHFLLSVAAGAALTNWFQAVLPSTCKIVVEPGSADPCLRGLGTSIPQVTLGASVALPATVTTIAKLSRHAKTTEANAAAQAQLTMAGPTTFTSGISGCSLAGAFIATVNASSTVVDPATISVLYSVAAGKELQIIGKNATPLYGANSIITLASGAKFSAVRR